MNANDNTQRAPRNKTLCLAEGELERYGSQCLHLHDATHAEHLCNRVIQQDLFAIQSFLPDAFVDLLFIDPPYNQHKTFNSTSFRKRSTDEYRAWMESWFPALLRTLKPTASVYICGDWRSSGVIQELAARHLLVRNRITWEREKGRGALNNWKNCSEDIWYCTVSDQFHFDVDAVKLRRRVIAPYKDASGKPKDWTEEKQGRFRLTHPSNTWTDITVPFWSMPENTEHPTQKPEKLLARIILASSRPGDLVFDPFMGSGTAPVVARKLGRAFTGIEIDRRYCALALKRLEAARENRSIQGYTDGAFDERNAGRRVAE